MANLRVRSAACTLLSLTLWHVYVIEARAQQYNKQNPQQLGTRPQQRPQARQTTTQNKTGNRNSSQSPRVATRTQPAGQAKPQAEATSIEKLDPEKRAAF